MADMFAGVHRTITREAVTMACSAAACVCATPRQAAIMAGRVAAHALGRTIVCGIGRQLQQVLGAASGRLLHQDLLRAWRHVLYLSHHRPWPLFQLQTFPLNATWARMRM